jgi:predicted enzyme related to lactoylglutathione lyase
VLDAGAVALALAGAGEQPADRIALGVKVTDLDAAVNDVVRDGGVVLDPPRDGEHERRAACRDRFGTVLAFYEPRAT